MLLTAATCLLLFCASAAQAQFIPVNATSFNTSAGVGVGTSVENMPYVKNIENGDYTGYNAINLNGVTSFVARTASGGLGGNIEIHLDSPTGTLAGTVAVPVTGGNGGSNNGWETWVDVSCQLTGASGVHAVYLVFTGGTGASLFNVEWFSFRYQNPSGITEAATYNLVSSGIGLQNCSEGGQNIDFLSNNSYTAYNAINLAGLTTFSARVASNSLGGAIHMRLDSSTGTEIGSCTVSPTGGWQNWTTVSCSITATTGFHTVYLVYTGGASGTLFNVEWFTLNYGMPGAPNFGSNVSIFTPSMSMSSIQSTVSSVFSKQQSNQFGPQRYAFLFAPGSYSLNIDVGFYTQVLGLGQNPDDVTITGRIESDGFLANQNATCNFTRSVENLAVVPTTGSVSNTMTWAVAQGCSLRLAHVRGNLNLANTGSQAYASGGYLADCAIDGNVNSLSQSQWFSRNADWGSWHSSTWNGWNMVFMGNATPPSNSWPNPPFTVVGNTPLIREKPYLTIDGNGNYWVNVPSLQTNTNGTTWASGPTPGVAVPISEFYLAQPGVDTAETINAALNLGQNILFLPGKFHFDTNLHVTWPSTILLGLGFPTLIPDDGTATIVIDDIGGVTVSGLILDAGPNLSPVLLQVGPSGSWLDHSADPTFLYDLVVRVGGETGGTTSSCLQINENNVVGDNVWVWRADHGNGVGWTANACNNGLIVNGNNVTMYGLAVEHHEQYQTLWNGNGGQTYFYQSEMPYDAPSQSAWMHNGLNGYPSYKLGSSVTSHFGTGIGIYGVFISTSASSYNAIEAPSVSGISLNNLTDVWINGNSGTQITHILNGTGGTVSSSNSVATLRSGN